MNSSNAGLVIAIHSYEVVPKIFIAVLTKIITATYLNWWVPATYITLGSSGWRKNSPHLGTPESGWMTGGEVFFH